MSAKERQESPSGGFKDKLKSFFKWFLIITVPIVMIASCSYIRAGWNFFDKGKDVSLDELPSYFATTTGDSVLDLNKQVYESTLNCDGKVYTCPFTYNMGYLHLDLSSYEEEGKPEGDFTVVETGMIYWPSRNSFLFSEEI